jgi:hypothetical protein
MALELVHCPDADLLAGDVLVQASSGDCVRFPSWSTSTKGNPHMLTALIHAQHTTGASA